MNYQLFELNHAALSPLRAAADVAKLYFRNPINPLSHTALGRSMVAALEVFERSTRVYGKPVFGISSTEVRGVRTPVTEEIVWERPFCKLLHFRRGTAEESRKDPKLLIVAPMSGHYATLLRGTVEAMLPRQDVYITDWTDARMVPLAEGRFDLDGYIDYVIAMLRFLGPNTHVMAVCQPAVPVLAATALMEEDKDPAAPATMTLMGGPIDTRVGETEVNRLAKERGIDWFRRNVILSVPFPHPGFMRQVYPGFLQLSGFMSMNLDRHVDAQSAFYRHLIKGDGDSARKHTEFYDEYLAVMDLTAEFYLQTVQTVFINHDLPKGTMTHRERRVDPAKVKRTAMLTIEGEFDDISGPGQTRAAHDLCTGIPEDRRIHYTQAGVGHYGVFNGSRFRAEIAPRISDFIWTFDRRPRREVPAAKPETEAAAPEAGPQAAEVETAEVEAATAATAAVPADAVVESAPAAPAIHAAVEPEPAEAATAAPAPATARKATRAAGKAKAEPKVEAKVEAEATTETEAKTETEAEAGATPAPVADDTPKAAAKPKRAPRARTAADMPATLAPKSTLGRKPGSLGAAGDDLTRIKGVGPSIAKALRDLGYGRFADIAGLDAAAIARIEEHIGFPGRVVRDGWIDQAAALIARH
ncbi:polyhydroxyalkanoate depolymerase, intracellular [Pseudoxanthobacter soli DSM 19599]|uniref:Polyhydroxyalkanoate depolymerase, intracellular n=1 Tax=Pseudoxanthobacter soli DSM 19599 TaxID=1123029 RepID=A0A1M7ZCE6_9HYPH|nr:polyhydroxyalkanoate depolymerase [Pseudoxanthobacter soli]SHO62366.1 polyhydroxyalkanoate depolymerase, intracellular [Pseudoxanthobacter soli DSM 19599]